MESDGEPAGDNEPGVPETTRVVVRGEELLDRAKALSGRVGDQWWRLCGVDRRSRERPRLAAGGGGVGVSGRSSGRRRAT